MLGVNYRRGRHPQQHHRKNPLHSLRRDAGGYPGPYPRTGQNRRQQNPYPLPRNRATPVVAHDTGDVGKQDRHPVGSVGDVGVEHQGQERDGQGRSPTRHRVDEPGGESGYQQQDQLGGHLAR